MSATTRQIGGWVALVLVSLGALAVSRASQADSAAAHSGPAQTAWECNPTTGFARPLPVCTPEEPCLRPAPELGVERVTEPTSIPQCRTWNLRRARFDDGPPLEGRDRDGLARHACLFRPAGTSERSPRPLVVWLHGGGAGSADDVYDHTSLRGKAAEFDLTRDPARRGFLLLSVQGRNLRYPTAAPRDGRHHDFYFRDLAAPSANPDVAWLDALIDTLAAEGMVDTRRIYVMGWSNGGFFGQLYAVARFVTPTPGGHRVAAAVAYTAADPFHNTRHVQEPSCRLDPYPRSEVPILLVSRACGVVACDAAQALSLAARGYVPEPGQVVAPWFADLSTRVGSRGAHWDILTGLGTRTTRCTPAVLCVPAVATLNHVRWPDGFADGSGLNHEPQMLGFLRDHPLP